jgi:hypothetical protein
MLLCEYKTQLDLRISDFSQVCTGHTPFDDLNQTALLLQIIGAHRPSRPADGEISCLLLTDALWAMVQACWAQVATDRPTAADVVLQLAAMALEMTEDEESPKVPLLGCRRRRSGLEPDGEPATKRTRTLRLEVSSEPPEPHESLEGEGASAPTALPGHEISVLTFSSALEVSWRQRTEARVHYLKWRSRAGTSTLCAWHRPRLWRAHLHQHPQNSASTMSCGCTYEEGLFEESLLRNIGKILGLPGHDFDMDPELRNPLLKLLQDRYGYRDGDFERDPETGAWKEGESPLDWQQRFLLMQPDADSTLRLSIVNTERTPLLLSPTTEPQATPTASLLSLEVHRRTATEARVRDLCSLNTAGFRRCAWHEARRESFVYLPRSAPSGKLNCGCTHEEALFEESLAWKGVGVYPPDSFGTKLEPELRNPLFLLLQKRYGYRDGDFYDDVFREGGSQRNVERGERDVSVQYGTFG